MLRYTSGLPGSRARVKQRTNQLNVCVTPDTLLYVLQDKANENVVVTFNRVSAPDSLQSHESKYFWREIRDVSLDEMKGSFPIYLVPRGEFFSNHDLFADYIQSRTESVCIPTYNEFLSCGSLHLPVGVGQNLGANTPANLLAFRSPVAEHLGVSEMYKSVRNDLVKICRRIAGFGQRPSFNYVLHKFRFEPGLEEYVMQDRDFVEFLK